MNLWRLLMFVGFYLAQNQYFGWNPWPKSDAELVADGITFLLASLAFKGTSISLKRKKPAEQQATQSHLHVHLPSGNEHILNGSVEGFRLYSKPERTVH